MSRFINYIRDTKAELTHVAWPTGKQAMTATVLVVLISLLIALFTGGLDYVFSQAIDWFIQ